jgi:hypothetical protein
VRWIGGTGYVVSLLDGVNDVLRGGKPVSLSFDATIRIVFKWWIASSSARGARFRISVSFTLLAAAITEVLGIANVVCNSQ